MVQKAHLKRRRRLIYDYKAPLNYCHGSVGVLYSLTLQVQSLHLILQRQK